MVKDFLTVKDVARILNIYDVSARELLDGVIAFEAGELFELSQGSGVTVAKLLDGEKMTK